MMKQLIKTMSFFVLIMSVVPINPASAGFIAKRYGQSYTVTPAMMHAIEMIVAEHARMVRHRARH